MIITGLPEWFVMCMDIIGFFIFVFGFLIIINDDHSNHPRLKVFIGLVLAITGLVMFVGIIFSLVSLTPNSLAIDENGIWYGEGSHIFRSLTVVPTKGSIVIAPNKELVYNLTPQEVVLLAKGSHFPERLRTIRYEGYNITLEDIPQGIDPSHLKLVISFNPVFLCYNIFI
jgi:hypothetical protein